MTLLYEHEVDGPVHQATRLTAIQGDAGSERPPTVVITGRHEVLPELVIACKQADLDIHAAEVRPADLPADIAPASIHCYIQMPPPAADLTAGPLGRVRATAERLRERFDALARIAPLLAPTATVLLVSDEAAGPTNGALTLLADALRGDHPRARVYVLDSSHTGSEVARRARRETAPARPWATYLDVAAELPYTDWRDEILTID